MECVAADGDVSVKVRSEGGEFKHNKRVCLVPE